MIKNYWYAIHRSEGVSKKPLSIKRFGENMVLWRNSEDQLSCFLDRCPHRGTALSLGKIVNNSLECAYHGFRYNETGQCIDVPIAPKKNNCARMLKVRQFPIQESQGLIWLWWGNPRQTYPALPWFDDLLDATKPFVELDRISPISFGRFMEANLDFAHFYFVHKFIRMPGMGPLADPFTCSTQGDSLKISGILRHDDDKTSVSNKRIKLDAEILFPGLASYDAPAKKEKKNRSIVAASPVDGSSTWFTYRVYLKPGLSLPLQRTFWKWIFLKMIFPIVHRQDLRLITRQGPSEMGIHSDSLVTAADQGIVQYFQLWRHAQAKEKAQTSDSCEQRVG